jgi:hypothetical protein
MPKTSGETVTLTPAAATKLTFNPSGKGLTQESGDDTPADHGIEIGGNALLVASATYTVASESGVLGTLEVTDELTIGHGELLDGFNNTSDSASLVLTATNDANGAQLIGAGSVVAGKTTIGAGDGSAGWTAGGAAGTIAIEADKIDGSVAGATLTAGQAGNVITVAVGGALVIGDSNTVDLADKGSLVLTGGDGATGAKLLSLGDANMGVVKFGNASITGGNAGADGWQAVGASTTIKFAAAAVATPSITGTGTTPKLVGVGTATGAIEIASDGTTSTNLTVTLAEIDLTAGGSVVINATSSESTLTLKHGGGTAGAQAKLTFNSTVTDASVSTANNRAKVYQASDASKTNAGTTDTSKSGIAVRAASGEANAEAGSIAGAANSDDAVITGQANTNAVTLDNTALFGTN